jgi:hypothetical protein
MTALAIPMESVRDSRIYRVNAWRELKGRPALDFDKVVLRLEPSKDDGKPHPPEWWTAENTAAWQRQVWRGEVQASDAQLTWGRKYGHGDHIPKGHFPPPTKAQYKAWEKDYLASHA